MRKVVVCTTLLVLLGCGQEDEHNLVSDLPAEEVEKIPFTDFPLTNLPIGTRPVATGYTRFALAMTSSTSPEVSSSRDLEEVVVTVARITMKKSSGGWIELHNTPVTINLLALSTTAIDLGVVDLPSQEFRELRLYVMNQPSPYVAFSDGSREPLRIRSSSQRDMIRLRGRWVLEPCTSVRIHLALDQRRTIRLRVVNGKERWIMRPVIRPIFEINLVGCDQNASPSLPVNLNSEE